MDIRVITGAAIEPWLPTVAQLRISVFREFPYLYEGTLDYEMQYLRHYTQSPDSVFVLACADDAVIGVSTGVPLMHADAAFREPFERTGHAPRSVFYFGESVLDRQWRGQGIGHRFFDERERHAQAWGARVTAFCAVERPAAHPARPVNYRPLDAFWQSRGYVHQPSLRLDFRWRDIGDQHETPKPMSFWIRECPK